MKIKVKELIFLLGGNTKLIIMDTNHNTYKTLIQGTIDDIIFQSIPYGEYEVEHATVLNGEDVFQIHICLK